MQAVNALVAWSSLPRQFGGIRTSAAVSILLMASAQIASPLIDEPIISSWLVIVGLATATWSFSRKSWPTGHLLLAISSVFVSAMTIEVIGVHFDVPFGQYAYTPRLQPQILDVPVLIGVAWVAMLLPAWEIARRITGGRFAQASCCGIAMVIWDLFLDPQMIHNNFWFFSSSNGWQGVPISNAVGWFVAGTLLAWIPALLLERTVTNGGLAFLYTWMIGFSVLGYLIPFALDNWQIGIVGALCAMPLFYLAFHKRDRTWLISQ
jgi:putative membrane protein